MSEDERRDELGKAVRDAWVERRLVKGGTGYIESWDEMTEYDRETDRLIADAVIRRYRQFRLEGMS